MADARTLHRLIFLFILAGLALSIYAALEVRYAALQGGCSVNGFISCQAVDSSGLTTIGPVPDWAIGLGGFLVLLVLDIGLLRSFDRSLLLAVALLSAVGLAVAAYLAYVELVLIGALCPVCLGAYVADAGVLGLAWRLRTLRNRAEEGREDTPAAPAEAEPTST